MSTTVNRRKNSMRAKSSYLNMRGIKTREEIISIIDDFLYNDYFNAFFTRWYSSNMQVTRDVIEKNYNPYGYMDKIIDELKILAPTYRIFNTNEDKKLKWLNKAIDDMEWDSLQQEIIETLETKGDFFAYWYYEISDNFVEGWKKVALKSGGYFWENPIPQVRVLESEKMVDIILDKNYKPKQYVYEEYYIEESVNETGELKNSETYKITKVFEKGRILVTDGKTGKTTILMNKEFESDVIRIIHVPSFKKRNSKFSDIQATKYIDLVLMLDAITSDYRLINKMSAHPTLATLDIEYIVENTNNEPGGTIAMKTLVTGNEGVTPSPQFKLLQPTALVTLSDERDMVDTVLYKKTGLTREKLEETMSTTDSSRLPAQIRVPLENKFRKYFVNTNGGFRSYFESVLRYNKAYKKTDKVIKFQEPTTFINGSIFDKLEVINNKLALGLTTMKEEWKNDGLTSEEIVERENRIIEEFMAKNKDITVTKNSSNVAKGDTATVNTDNKLKQDTNVPV